MISAQNHEKQKTISVPNKRNNYKGTNEDQSKYKRGWEVTF